MTFIGSNANQGGGGGGGPAIACAPLVFGDAALTSTTVTRYLHPGGGWNNSADTTLIPVTMQGAGTLKRLQVRIAAGAGNGNPIVYTVLKNGVQQVGLQLSVPSTSSGTFTVSADVAYVDADEIAIEVVKVTAVGSSPQDVQAFLQVECDAGGGGGGGAAIVPLQNTYYVATNGDDATGTGSIAEPYLTLQRAYTEIGNAADNAEWNDPALRYWVVRMSAGIYTGNAIMPVRPSVWTHLDGATIDGTLLLVFPDALITSGIGSPQWGFSGNGRRSVWDATGLHTVNGITGDVQMDFSGVGQGVSFFPQLHLERTGLLGDLQVTGTFSGGQLFMVDAVIVGSIQNNGDAFSVWADGVNNEDAGDVQGIGGVQGNVNLFHLNNVMLRSAQPTTSGVNGWRWYNTRLLDQAAGGAFDFSFVDSDVQMDESTYEEYVQAVDVAGGVGLDNARIDIDDGDPWRQVELDGPVVFAPLTPVAPVAGLTITNLLAGSYDFGLNSIGRTQSDPGSGTAQLYKNGVPVVNAVGRIVFFQAAGTIDNSSNVTIRKIVPAVPGDVFEIWAVNGGAPGSDFSLSDIVFLAIRVGPEIPVPAL